MNAHPGSYLGPYRLTRRIGSGGMGQVFAATHARMDHEVAVKLLSPEAAEDPQMVARFIQEARALAQLQHPNIVRVLHCEELADGTVYLAMEHLHGPSLREWLREQQRPPDLAVILAIGAQIADAMVDVHARGIVHRDLKPENIILVPGETLGLGPRVKLLDFGIAKVPPAADRSSPDTQVQTRAPILLGSATYMAPEQCRNAAQVTGSADVYALGVLLFEMIAGRPPFVSGEPIDVISMHVRSEPPSLLELASSIPAPLGVFVSSMLAKDPAARPTMHRVRDVLAQPWESGAAKCPFPGIHSFTESKAELFFGRLAEMDDITALLERARRGEQCWLQIEGPSGAGKSSLVQAGVLPRIRAERTPDRPCWRIAVLRPSYDPLRSLAQAIVAAYRGPGFDLTATDVEQRLRANADALDAVVTAHTPHGCILLLVVEQMEELYTLGAAECYQFDALVTRALTQPKSPVRLLTTLRSDFLHRLDQTPGLARLLNQAFRYHLHAMQEQGLVHVVRKMAQLAGLRLTEGLAERMARDAASSDSPLPLLGHMLHQLWTPFTGAFLTHERYEELGGVGGALALQVERLLSGLGQPGCERAKWLILDLVQVGRGVPDTRRPRRKEEVLVAAGGDALAEEVLLRLSGAAARGSGNGTEDLRLVTLSTPAASSQSDQRVDLVHETLLQKVPTIASWIDSERTVLERHDDLEVAARAWEQSGSPLEGLPSGSLLDHYCGHGGDARQRHLLMRMASERARRFVQTAQRLDRRRSLRRRVLTAILLVLTTVASASTVYVFREQQRAEGFRQAAEANRTIAEANRTHVIMAIEKFVSETDWVLQRYPYMMPVRRQMLEDFDTTLASLLDNNRNALEVGMAVIKTKHRLGDLALLDESLARADLFYTEALHEIRRLPASELTFRLALNHSKRGKVAMARGQTEEARRRFAESIELLENLYGGDTSEDSLRTLATSYWEHAELEKELNRADAAIHYADRALAMFTEIAGLNQSDPVYNESLWALALTTRAEIAVQGHDLGTANLHLDRSLQMQKPLVESDRGNAYYRSILARIHVAYGALRVQQHQLAGAIEHYHEAQKLGRVLYKGDPTNKNYALVLCQGLKQDEALAGSQGDRGRAERLRRERCAVAGIFAGRDSEDVRFQHLGCP